MIPSSLHVPVLSRAVLDGLRLGSLADSQEPSASREASDENRSRIWVDGTFGGGGHALQIATALPPQDRLIGIDRDPSAIQRFVDWASGNSEFRVRRERDAWILERPDSPTWILAHASYCELPEWLAKLDMPAVDGIVLDLGLSSDQLEDTERGFSFRLGGSLDLRFDPTQGESAAELLATCEEKPLADLIYRYGEERFSRRIARAIVEARRVAPIATAEQLADLIHRSVPGRVHGRVDSATRTFQALRIAVNEELDHVETAMRRLPDCLALGGRLAVISFHSLEDRIVKHAMREDARLRVLTKKPQVADAQEISENPRSRSAKLRVAERVEGNVEGNSTPELPIPYSRANARSR